MNARERFNAVMHYKERDRCPIMDFGFWEETPIVWEEQGYPKGVNPDDYFGMDPQWAGVPIDTGLNPHFGSTVLEDRGETKIVRGPDGVTVEHGGFLGSIPRHIDHTLKDRASWEREFVHRLNGKSAARYPGNWEELKAEYTRPDREYPLSMPLGSLYGNIRNYMSVENLSLLVYDDSVLFEEMVETTTTCIIDSITPALKAGIRPDFGQIWEDMCYKSGPLLSPRIFKRVLVPNYRRITNLLRDYGCDVVLVDCDGDITQLLPLWLEAGVNLMFPIEVGTWGADPVKMRAEYGKELLIMGGVGKRILASTKDAITAEVERLAPLVEEGGFIPTPDHRVPPDVSLSNYIHYLKEARRVWGKGLSNLRPILADQSTGLAGQAGETRAMAAGVEA